MRLLHPQARDDITIEEAYRSMLGGRTDRPWVAVCMIASLDGSTVVDGRSGPLGNETDSAVLRQMRATADVIVVGSQTATHESYGPPGKPGQRLGVVTARGRVDLGRELFTSGAGFVVTTEESPIDPTSHDGVDVVRAGRGRVDLARAIAGVDELCGRPDSILFEGGPTLNGALFDADLIDEWDITTSPLAVGGGGPRLATDADDTLHRFELAQVALDTDSFLFSRWRRRRI